MPYSKNNKESLGHVLFGKKHSYTEYGMVLDSFDVSPPRRKITKYTNSYIDGDNDITDKLQSEEYFENRSIALVFSVLANDITNENRQEIHKKIVSELNGKYFDCGIYISVTDMWYTGRVSVDGVKHLPSGIKVTISVDAKPYADKIIAESSTGTLTPTDAGTTSSYKSITTDIPGDVFTKMKVGYLVLAKSNRGEGYTNIKCNCITGSSYVDIDSSGFKELGYATTATSTSKKIVAEVKNYSTMDITMQIRERVHE